MHPCKNCFQISIPINHIAVPTLELVGALRDKSAYAQSGCTLRPESWYSHQLYRTLHWRGCELTSWEDCVPRTNLMNNPQVLFL